MSFLSEGFANGISESTPELSPSFGGGHGGMESNVEDIPPPTTNVKLRKVVMAIVGQDLRYGRKYALRHAGASLPSSGFTDA